MLLPIIPWTVHNYVQLDRIVPISTGSGKALYVGTYLPADGDYQRVKAELHERFTGERLEPGSDALDEVDPVPLFDRVAERVPGTFARRGARQGRPREPGPLSQRRPGRLRRDDAAQDLANVELGRR